MTYPRLCLLAGALLLLAGCRSPAANRLQIPAPPGEPQLEVVNSGLQGEVEILQGESEALYESELLTGKVALKNHLEQKLKLQYRWRYEDADGREMRPGGGSQIWQNVFLNPLERKQVTGLAPQPGAVRAEFSLRYAPESLK